MGGVTAIYFSRAEVARLFHVSPATVARWSRQGKLPYTVTLGGRRRYPRGKILALAHEIERETGGNEAFRGGAGREVQVEDGKGGEAR